MKWWPWPVVCVAVLAYAVVTGAILIRLADSHREAPGIAGPGVELPGAAALLQRLEESEGRPGWSLGAAVPVPGSVVRNGVAAAYLASGPEADEGCWAVGVYYDNPCSLCRDVRALGVFRQKSIELQRVLLLEPFEGEAGLLDAEDFLEQLEGRRGDEPLVPEQGIDALTGATRSSTGLLKALEAAREWLMVYDDSRTAGCDDGPQAVLPGREQPSSLTAAEGVARN